VDNPLYHLEGIRLVRGGRSILAVDALDVERGEVCAVVGHNGAGKTTLLRLLAFLLRPDEGWIAFRGRPFGPQKAPPPDLRREVTLVMQDPYLFSGTVLSNAAYGLRARGVPAREARDRAAISLDRVGLSSFADRKAGSLSGGESKRLAVARALAVDPAVLLLDEPTADVDEENGRRIESTLSQLNREGETTVVLSTHDKDQALRLSSRILSLSGGRVIDAHPLNLFEGEVVRTGEGPSWRRAPSGSPSTPPSS
jgi:tungstate transport system ATP-binding protein